MLAGVSSVVAGPVFEDGTSAAAVAHFHRAGWVHVRPADGDGLARDLRAWADEVSAWGDAPEGPGGWLQYREMTDRGTTPARSTAWPSRGWTSSRPSSTPWPVRPRGADRCCASSP